MLVLEFQFFILLSFTPVLWSSYSDWYQDLDPEYAEFVASENERGLFPNIFNLATNAIINSTATCGTQKPEDYCKLVEHIFMRRPQCDICDNNDPYKRHPIEYAIDGSPRWWQSPSLANGLEFEQVNITLDLRQQYQVAYVIVKAAIAPRPGTWVLERSLDGVNWLPWQYYAATEPDCMRVFGIPATRYLNKFSDDTEVICTSHYSRLDKIEDGEIHTSLVNGRPGVTGPSLELQAFTRARYVRLRLLKLKTLNADLMIITRGQNFDHLDKSVTRRYFYAIKDISIGGQCICYGHAESCPADPVTGQLRCECKHNTCGESCEKCCPLFNQRKWMPGTNEDSHICQPCQCFNHAVECRFDDETERLGLSVTPDGIYEGGGVCVDCQHSTRGVNCEECEEFYYRPSGVSHYREDACRPCDCDETGSVDGTCVKDETRAINGLRAGDCLCRPGFGGRRCDRCAEGYRNYPTCDPCPCDMAGSSNYATCEDDCICKRNVEGTFCDRCKPGFINLDASNPDGCQPCFCFGMSEQCKEITWGKDRVRVMHGWNLTDAEGRRDLAVASESGHSLIFNSRQIQDYAILRYWEAPKDYTGNLLTSYGGVLHYVVYYVPEAEGGRSRGLADVIIGGNGGKIEYHSMQEFFERENVSVQVKLHESEKWYDAQTRRPVNKQELMRVLANVDLLLIRSQYHDYQVQSSLYGLSLGRVSETSSSSDRLKSVEQCECPPNFTGLSCEKCVSGFRRTNNILYDGTCVECSCHEHSLECDPYTGHCLNCLHGTTGFRCEHCLQGYYGNPSLGGKEGACTQCGCPLTNPENNFSPTCILANYSRTTGAADYVCTGCQDGYVGNKCEMCEDGYFGKPTEVNGTCKLCECNENIDPAAVGNCNRVTGECLKCIGNTEGFSCEKCKPNHWGSALEHSCRDCECHGKGSLDPQCNNTTGQCECEDLYVGIRCDRCEAGHGDVDKGCPECACNVTGSLSDICHTVSGQCDCKPGVFGKRCDTCQDGYFGFSERGCEFCGCDRRGSVEDGKCDIISGQCECRPNVVGKMCSYCEEGFFNISSKEGCQPCECNSVGAEDTTCDPVSGQCGCKIGVTGLKCDKCAPNHFGLSKEGCKECPRCPVPGQVCDQETGECICPPNTVGDRCEDCAENSWNYNAWEGCEECDCNSEGAEGPDCDLYTGQCNCRSGYSGQKCDQCNLGHFDFPRCRQCKCNLAGTAKEQCRENGKCACDEDGQCPCKENVKGKKCNECKANSISMERDNPLGCIKCFCFNRTNFCVQATYVWQQIFSEDRLALFMEPYQYYEQAFGLRILPESPPTINSYPTDDTPLYWEMPRSFLGDRVASYNGFLRFQATNTDDNFLKGSMRPNQRHFTRYPLVVLRGNNRMILEYYPDQKVPDNGRYKVKLREDLWKSRNTPEVPVTRKQLMVALQKLEGVYVRATFAYGVKEASLSDISLDVAVWDNTTYTDSEDNTAVGVEDCSGDCPQGYSGTSCQNPAEGYCRKLKPSYLDSMEDLDLLGYAEPCACSGHSTTCDPETCSCTDCQHNTDGDACQYCARGYYGDATSGVPEACQKCACPLRDNSFSDTCYAVQSGKGYVCDACKPGYEGTYCEMCQEGYFGDPTVPGGSCQPCACHVYGSFGGSCDGRTGQCECRQGVTGRDCSECQARHALIGAVCTSCDQGCTLELMQDIDKMTDLLDSRNFSHLVVVPWKRLRRIENMTSQYEEGLTGIEEGAVEAKKMVDELGDAQKHLKDAQSILEQAEFLNENAKEKQKEMKQFDEAVMDIEQRMRDALRKAYDLVNILRRYAVSGGDRKIGVDVSAWLDEAAALLREMKDTDEYLEKRFNRAEMELLEAKKLLENINVQKLNGTIFDGLHDRLDNFTWRIDTTRNTVWQDASKPATSALKVGEVNRLRMEEFDRTVGRIEDAVKMAQDMLNNAESNEEKAKQSLVDAHDHYWKINGTLIGKLDTATTTCSLKSSSYNDLVNQYRDEYLQKSKDHADRLMEEAGRLESSFQRTKDASKLAVAASSAYDNIVEALRNATNAAVAAKKAAQETYNEAYPSSDRSLTDRAENTKNSSLGLRDAANQMEENDGSKDLEKFKQRLGDVNEEVIAGKKDLADYTKSWNEFDEKNDELQRATEKATQAKKVANEVTQSSDDLVQNVRMLEDEMTDIQAVTAPEIRELTANMNRSRDLVTEAVKNLADVQDEAKKNEETLDSLSNSLVLLKEKIKEARDKASRIRVSVKSDHSGQCQRAYGFQLQPTPVSSIEIKFRPLQDVADSLIFLARTRRRRTQASEYIALELVDRRFVFHWNIGSGDNRITNSKTAAYDQNSWYQVNIIRRGDTASLSVSVLKVTSQGLDEEGEPEVVEHSVESDYRIFNARQDTQISLGSDPTDKPPNARTSEFRGTIGEMKIEGRRVPLWDFVSTSGRCDGAAKVDEQAAGAGLGAFMFRDGYAQIAAGASQYIYTTFSIQILFSSYSARGLLYFRGDQSNGDFVSIELVDGRVVMQFYLGGRSSIRLVSNGYYNDGQTHAIYATRDKRNGTLQVDSKGDTVNGEAEGSNEGLNVKTADHFVGGVPESYNRTEFERFGVTWKGFYGCIQRVQPISGEVLDLNTALKSLNYEEGCQTKKDGRLLTSDRVVSFEPEDATGGYLVVPGIALSDMGSFAFGFKTKQENATLVYQSSRVATYRRKARQASKGQGFLSAYLYRGSLTVTLGTDASGKRGEKVLGLRSEGKYGDGNMHSVFLERNGESVRLLIDDKEVGSGTLTDRKTIGFEGAQLFLGGMKKGTKPVSGEYPTSVVPLRGCIADLYSNLERVPLAPEEHANTRIGVCAEEAPAGLRAEDALQADSGSWSHQKTDKLHFLEGKPASLALKKKKKERKDKKKKIGPISESEVKCSPPPVWSMYETEAVEFGRMDQSFSQVDLNELGPRRRTRPENFTIALTFRTEQSHGALFFWANRKYAQFMNMSVVDGRIVYRIRGHRPDRQVQSNITVNDGAWHTVTVVKWARRVSMDVDQKESVSVGRTPTKIRILRKRFFVGGFPDYTRERRGFTIPNFVGCIKDFTFNDIPVPVLKYGRNVEVCGTTAGEAVDQVFIQKSGFVGFETGSMGEVSFEVDFKTNSPDGSIITLMTDLTGSTQLSVSLLQGEIQGVVTFNNETVGLVSFGSEFCDGEWHTTTTSLKDGKMFVSTDGLSRNTNLAKPGVVDVLKSGPMLFVGGQAEGIGKIMPKSGAGLGGCIRNVKSSEKTFQLSHMKRQFGIVNGVCP